MSQSTNVVESHETLPKLLRWSYLNKGSSLAMRRKDRGIWREYSWQDYYDTVKHFGLGLLALGLEPGDRVTIIGDNDPELYWAELATQAVGGVAVSLYTDAIIAEAKYIVEHSDTKFVVAGDQEQVDKTLQIKTELPRIKNIIYWDPKGLWFYDDPCLLSFTSVVDMGKEYEQSHPGLFEQRLERGKADDLAIICYTSGTMALPKGAMLSHRNLISHMRQWQAVDPVGGTDEYVSYMSPAWIGEQALGIAGSLASGVVVNFIEEPETVNENVREIGPALLLYGSRLWESVVSTVQAKMLDAGWLNRAFYHLAVKVGYQIVEREERGIKPNILQKAVYGLLYLLVFRPLQDKLGLLKTRYAYTGGAALSPDSFKFLRALGINIKQVYGTTEGGTVTDHPDSEVRFETVGRMLPNKEVKISSEGEIMCRSECNFLGYYKDPEATAKVLKDGWFYTGDAGYIDKEHLIYWDRVSDLIELADGQKFSPVYISGRLKFSPYIKDVAILGGKDKPFISAIVTIDFDIVGKWAERKKISYTTYVDLSQKPAVGEMIKQDMEQVNRTLPDASRVRRFVVLHKEFDPDEAELTRTRKLRLAFLEQKYGELVEAIYQERQNYEVEAKVVYRDGRTGSVKTNLVIYSL